jgi:hypothetical protein
VQTGDLVPGTLDGLFQTGRFLLVQGKDEDSSGDGGVLGEGLEEVSQVAEESSSATAGSAAVRVFGDDNYSLLLSRVLEYFDNYGWQSQHPNDTRHLLQRTLRNPLVRGQLVASDGNMHRLGQERARKSPHGFRPGGGDYIAIMD